jgi:hypothetical protein
MMTHLFGTYHRVALPDSGQREQIWFGRDGEGRRLSASWGSRTDGRVERYYLRSRGSGNGKALGDGEGVSHKIRLVRKQMNGLEHAKTVSSEGNGMQFPRLFARVETLAP